MDGEWLEGMSFPCTDGAGTTDRLDNRDKPGCPSILNVQDTRPGGSGGMGGCAGGGHVVLGGDTGTVEVPDARSPEGSYV